MKPSQYNIILYSEGTAYWYNTLTRYYFKTTEALGRKLQSLLRNCDLASTLAPAFYDSLVDKGFIVEDSTDELGLVIERYTKAVNSKHYYMTVLPTLNCNFQCHYCIQHHIPTVMSPETIARIKRHIEYMAKEEHITGLHLDFFGGEPFMFFKQVIKPIIIFATKICEAYKIPFYTTATTNGYYIDSEVAGELTELKFIHFQITLDGDRDIHNSVKYQKGCESAFDHVLTNINTILNKNKDIQISLRLNYTHRNFTENIVKQVNGIVEEKNRARITICPHKVWQVDVDKTFNIQPLLDLFHQFGYQVRRWNPSHHPYPCYVSLKYYNTINYNGDLVKCTANEDLYSEEPKGYLDDKGHIVWNGDYEEKYTEPTFNNEECLRCVALPMCYGPCPRNHKNGNDSCKYLHVDENFDQSLLAYLKSALV